MKKVLMGFLSGFLLLVAVSSYSFAQMYGPAGGPREEGMSPMRHERMGMMGKDHHLWRMLAGLGLDEKQRDAIREIRTRFAKEDVRKRADIDVARIELRDILGKDQVDMAAAEGAVKKMSSLQGDLRLSHIKEIQEVKAKLTPEQRKKLREMREMGPWSEKKMHEGKRTSRRGQDAGPSERENGQGQEQRS